MFGVWISSESLADHTALFALISPDFALNTIVFALCWLWLALISDAETAIFPEAIFLPCTVEIPV